MSLKLNSSGGGSITLQEPSTTSNRTLTLPDNTGTVVSTASTGVISQAMLAAGVAGNGPAFSAYKTGSQTVSNATATKVILDSEFFDTANCFDSTTNYRFTPNIAGYYQINGNLYAKGTTSASTVIAFIYKNGSALTAGSFLSVQTASAGGNGMSSVSTVVYLNGTTDYVEFYGYVSGTGTLTFTNDGVLALTCAFSGAMVRAA